LSYNCVPAAHAREMLEYHTTMQSFWCAQERVLGETHSFITPGCGSWRPVMEYTVPRTEW
jgi:hypothetical protein